MQEYLGTANDPPSVSTIDWLRSRGSSNLGQSVSHPVISLSARTIELTPSKVLEYVKSLFPFIQWVPRYNLTWLGGDLIA